nr:exo-alpha-sialidase [Actinomycetota bacterium]
RVTSDGRLGIYRTADAGASWAPTVAVAPAWAAVLREGMGFDADGGVYAGTQSGFVYALREGQVAEVARHLPPILSVEASTWP